MTQPATAGTAPLIFGRIAAIMAEVPAIAKTETNKDQGFKFRGIEKIYNSLHDLMTRHCVFTTSEVLDIQRNEWLSKSGGKLIEFALRVRWTFWASDGSCVHSETMGQAMDSADKASNKAMTMSHKTALLQIFMIPTVDTPDADANTPDPQERFNQHNGQNIPLPPVPPPPPAPVYQQQAAQQAQPPTPPRATQGNQNHSYNGGGASGKQLDYLRDIVRRDAFEDVDRQYIEWAISQGLSREQCSGLIDRAQAYTNGTLNEAFVPSQQHSGQAQVKDDLPF